MVVIRAKPLGTKKKEAWGAYLVDVDTLMKVTSEGLSQCRSYSVTGGSELMVILAEACICVASATISSTDSLPR